MGSRWPAEGSLHGMDQISLVLLESELEFGRESPSGRSARSVSWPRNLLSWLSVPRCGPRPQPGGCAWHHSVVSPVPSSGLSNSLATAVLVHGCGQRRRLQDSLLV